MYSIKMLYPNALYMVLLNMLLLMSLYYIQMGFVKTLALWAFPSVNISSQHFFPNHVMCLWSKWDLMKSLISSFMWHYIHCWLQGLGGSFNVSFCVAVLQIENGICLHLKQQEQQILLTSSSKNRKQDLSNRGPNPAFKWDFSDRKMETK